eukprot:1906138-Pyramimonas_sp.AAC.1
MANVRAMGVVSVGKTMDRPNHTEDVLYSMFDVATGRKPPAALAEAKMVGQIERRGSSTAWDLPIKQWATSYLVDVAASPGDLSTVDWDAVNEIMKKGDYNDLPPPLGFPTKTEIPMFLNLHVSKPPDGDYIVVKFVKFLNNEKFHDIQRELVVGEPFVPHWTRDRYTTLKTIQL